MKPYKRIIAGFSAIATIFANVITVSAEVSSEPDKVGWWTGWMHRIAMRSDGMRIQDIPVGGIIANIVSDLSHGTVCEFSDDHWHHADESDYIKVSEGTDGTYAVRAQCKYCHKTFIVQDLTVEDLSDKYNDYVSTLPATGYDSAGKLLWQPRWSDCVENRFGFLIYAYRYSNDTLWIQTGVENPFLRDYSSDYLSASFSGSDLLISRSGPNTVTGWNNFRSVELRFYCSGNIYFEAPISGKYSVYRQASLYAERETGSNTNLYHSSLHSASKIGQWSLGQGGYLTDTPYFEFVSGDFTSSSQVGSFLILSGGRMNFRLSTPIYAIEPLSDTTTINNTYNINTRVNNFQGDYYDSVTNNYYNNTTIINETTNNYYDMTTNNYYTMSNWSYDYQSRTYFVTLEDGTTITVQFGDDCLTITNNNVENSYQYVIKNNNNPSTDPDTPTTCKHDWTETVDVEPTCLEGGHANFTCSLCGETYEQILSAKGHNWTVADHVNTVYGENGEIVTQGHTLYECSTCGEQWYTETAAPPPDVSGGTNILAWLQSFQTWLGAQLELVIDKIQVTINNTETNINNVTNVVIEETNNAYNVFYVTTENGDEKPIGEVAGDTLSASGKLLNFLYKLCFEGALSKVDDSITNMDGFYFDDGAGLEGSIWD